MHAEDIPVRAAACPPPPPCIDERQAKQPPVALACACRVRRGYVPHAGVLPTKQGFFVGHRVGVLGNKVLGATKWGPLGGCLRQGHGPGA